tara:strand:- start:3 stop:728 length:726 start_codon:yes stop_codon:yes gene_type:complete
MKSIRLIFFLSFICSIAIAKSDTIHVSEYLQIVPINEHTFLHISYIPYKESKFPCNGLVYIKDGQAAVLDTPVGDEASIDLIRWIMNDKKSIINHLIVNHFHEDCMSGLTTFVGTGCQTISHKKTCKLAGLQGYNCTQRYFEDSLVIDVAGTKIISYYFGAAHSDDNIVTYIPSDRILFGGCMIKEVGAGKGNLSDANKTEWPKTVTKVKNKFRKAKMVIPGHGKPGKKKLFDCTIDLFST